MSEEKPLLEQTKEDYNKRSLAVLGKASSVYPSYLLREDVEDAVCELKEYKEFTASPEKTRCDKCEEVYYVAFVREDDVYCYDCLIDEVFGEVEK